MTTFEVRITGERGAWGWQLLLADGSVRASSLESYSTKAEAEQAAREADQRAAVEVVAVEAPDAHVEGGFCAQAIDAEGDLVAQHELRERAQEAGADAEELA